jgi:hypothetical protein
MVTDWDGFYAGMLEEWILVPTRKGQEQSPEQALLKRHLKALVQLARLHTPDLSVGRSLGAGALFGWIGEAVPLAESVVYDLRELLDFLTRFDEEFDPFRFPPATLQAYAERVCAALELASQTFTWRLSTNRNRFIPRLVVEEFPPLPLAS